MIKRALIVGIDYRGTSNELRGCINDAYHMKEVYENRGFDDIRMVLEKEATTQDIINALMSLIQDVKSGDVIVFHYSGHGSQLPSRYEEDGFEEIICPIDLNWKDKVITDDTLKSIFNRVPHGANVTLVLDCCHSGTMLDQAESMENEEREIIEDPTDADRSPRYLPPPKAIIKALKGRHLVRWSTSRDVNQTALLIATCKEHQTSADAFIDGKYQGAGSYSLIKELEKNPTATYKELVNGMNKYMADERFSQEPVLDGSSLLYEEKFTEPYSVKIQSVSDWPADTPTDQEIYEQAKPKKKVNKELIMGAIGIAVFILVAIWLA